MASNSTTEQNALAAVMRADEEEANRAYWWRLLPAVDRLRALSLAGLDRARAGDELATFTVEERARVHGALCGHIARMEILARCCGIAVERRPTVRPGAVTRQAELEQQQDEARRRRQEFARLEQQQEQEQKQGKGFLH